MTDGAAQAARRWQQADDLARVVLASPPPRRVSIPLVLATVAVLTGLLVVAVLLTTPGSSPRWIVASVGAVAGLGLVVVEVVRAVLGRARRPQRLPVVQPLSPRERRAVVRAVRGAVQAPDDRRAVVHASAVQTAAGTALPGLFGQAFLVVSLASAGTFIWPLYLVAALPAAVAVVVALRDVRAARRFLDAHPVHS